MEYTRNGKAIFFILCARDRKIKGRHKLKVTFSEEQESEI